MFRKHGMYFPDGFPWPFDDAIAIMHKAAVINGVSVRDLLACFPYPRPKKDLDTSGEALRSVVAQFYEAGRYFLSYTNSEDKFLPYFPLGVFVPLRYCGTCQRQAGFTPSIFRLGFISRCPWHDEPLQPMCSRCLNVRIFKPPAIDSPEGHHCHKCGYYVPNRMAILEASRTKSASLLWQSCGDFVDAADCLHRLGILDVLDYQRPSLPYDIPSPSRPLSGMDCELSSWGKRVSLCQSDTPASTQRVYANYVGFHLRYMRAMHQNCICRNQLPGPEGNGVAQPTCLYALALAVFRFKMENDYELTDNIALSTPASRHLEVHALSSVDLLNFFKVNFYHGLSRLWFWALTHNAFSVHVDPQHFFAALATIPSKTLSTVYASAVPLPEWEHHCVLDLPAGQASLRALLRPTLGADTLKVTNYGQLVQVTSSQACTRPVFYGVPTGLACFYF